MTRDALSILACQIAIPPMTTAAERGAHLTSTAAKVDAALVAEPADVVVLPELSAIDYAHETFAALDELAEPLDGASYQCWASVARRHNCHIVYGFPRRERGLFHITMAVVGPDGALICHYDKLHMAQFGASMEKDYFERGDHLAVFSVGGFRLSPIICYDIRIPELSRTLALDHGVDAILHCGAYYRDESFATWHDFAVTRALENQVFLLSLNRAGAQYGGSLFCRPWMDDATPPDRFDAHAEDLRRIVLNRAELEAAREAYSFLKDRLAGYDLPVSGG